MTGLKLEPAFGRSPFAILFVMTILGHDKFGGQAQHLVAPRTHDHWQNGGVIIGQFVVAIGAVQTVLTVDRFGAKVTATVQRN